MTTMLQLQKLKSPEKTIDINNRNNNIKAGGDLLEGLTTKGLKTNETIEIQVKYTVTKEDLATALAGDKKDNKHSNSDFRG